MTRPIPLLARVGAVAYVIWALLHFQAAWSVYQLGQSLEPSPAQGRVLQDAWNLAAFSVAAIGVAVALNWRNGRAGFWLNAAIVSVADLGFIFFLLVPGHVPLWPGLLGPLFWILGLFASGVGRLQDQTSP